MHSMEHEKVHAHELALRNCGSTTTNFGGSLGWCTQLALW